MKIVTIVGNRPQFIKMALLDQYFRKKLTHIRSVVIHTGQHYDDNLSEIFFRELKILKPKYNLNVGSLRHGEQTGQMLSSIEKILLKEIPDWVLVYGDTNSTAAGALAASKLGIPIAHVEAGLRSYNRQMPEEINRVLTDHLSSVWFCPTVRAVKQLKKEGIGGRKVCRVGDVMYDAENFFGKSAQRKSKLLDKLHLTPKKYILATIHRAENTDDLKRLRIIVGALQKISKKIQIVFPLHPRTKKSLKIIGTSLEEENIHFIPPIGYLDMMMLEKQAAIIVTDSGGIQKEAFFYKIPCVTLRNETEWPETISLGWNRLATVKDPNMLAQIILGSIKRYGSQKEYPYGRGNASKQIVSWFLNQSSKQKKN